MDSAHLGKLVVDHYLDTGVPAFLFSSFGVAWTSLTSPAPIQLPYAFDQVFVLTGWLSSLIASLVHYTTR